MNIDCRTEGRNLVVAVDGDIDHHSAETIRDRVDREYERVKARHIVFDFSDVAFMDSSGIGMLIGRYKNVHKLGGIVAMAGVGKEMERIVEVSGLHKILQKYDSVEEAVQNIR